MVKCALCHGAEAVVFCYNDNANLCKSCDAQIHKTNKLTWKHQRVYLCEMCEGAPNPRPCTARKIRCEPISPPDSRTRTAARDASAPSRPSPRAFLRTSTFGIRFSRHEPRQLSSPSLPPRPS